MADHKMVKKTDVSRGGARGSFNRWLIGAAAAICALALGVILAVSVALRVEYGRVTPAHLLSIGNQLFERSDFESAEKVSLTALAAAEASGAVEERLSAMRLLAMTCEAQNKHDDAVRNLEQVVLLLEKERGLDDQDLGVAYSDLARLHVRHRDFEQGRRLHELALALYRRTLGSDHPRVAGSLCNLGIVAHLEGNLDEAEGLYKQATALLEAVPEAQYPDMANCLYNLATLYVAEGRYGEAETCLKRGIIIVENGAGVRAPELVPFLGKFEIVLRATGREDSAQEQRTRAAAIRGDASADSWRWQGALLR